MTVGVRVRRGTAMQVVRGRVGTALRTAALVALTILLAASGGRSLAAEVSPRRLVEVVDFGPPVVSPDGKRVAYRIEQASIERNAWETAWYVQEMDGHGAPRRVADGGVPLGSYIGGSLSADAVWSPDGRWIHYLASIDGRIDVWRAAADGSGAEALTHDEADVREFLLGEDGRGLFYRTGATRAQVVAAEQAEYHAGIRIGQEVPISHNLYRSLDTGSGLATQRYEGKWFAFVPLLADAPQGWKRLDLSSRETRELPADERPPLPPEAPDLAHAPSAAWTLAAEPAGPRIAVLAAPDRVDSLPGRGGGRLAMLEDRSSDRPVVCAADPCKAAAISAVQWRPGSDEVLFTVTDPDAGLAQTLFRWDVRSGEVQPVATAEGLLGGGRDRSTTCGVSDEALACVAADADSPPRLERIDLHTGDRRVLFDPNAALAADLARAPPARLVRWTDDEGKVFTGHLFEAQGRKVVPFPLFVNYYSCSGFLRGGAGDEWPLASLAAHGISALCINDPPGTPDDALERFDRGLRATRGFVDLLAAQGAVDRRKVGMGGLSFGAEVTLWTASQSGLLAAASVATPAIEPNYFLFNTLREDAFFVELKKTWGLGAPDETPERWRAFSPSHQLDRIRAPVLFQLSEQEYLYSLGLSLPLVRRDQGDLYVFPHEPHVKVQPRHRLAVYERNLDWFRFWLLGEEDAHPFKAGQYAHWRRMKAALAGSSEAEARGAP